MFNDLNNTNNSGRPAVDDIFAETDKPVTSGPQSDIETHRVGLAANGGTLPHIEPEKPAGSKKPLKLIIILVAVLAIFGISYFAYSQFFKPKDNSFVTTPIVNTKTTTTKTEVTKSTTEEVKATTTDVSFVAVIPGATTTPVISPISPASSTLATTSTSSEAQVESLIDSDSDALSDVDERKAGTNPNVIDTDNDGLSDYDEVIVYHTDPLNADTDGDSYLDGAEVKGGYNPCGALKLPTSAPLEELCSKFKK